VEVSAILMISKSLEDPGSAFYVLSCKSCKTVLGRKYITTLCKLDSLRGLYSLDASSIESYQLGTSLQDGERPSLENLPTLSSLHLQQLKMEQVILSFNERITDLEEDLAMLEDLAF
jgi:hypothetical protein